MYYIMQNIDLSTINVIARGKSDKYENKPLYLPPPCNNLTSAKTIGGNIYPPRRNLIISLNL